MMILSPVITLKSDAAPHGKPARDIFVGTLLVFAGLSILALAASSRQARCN